MILSLKEFFIKKTVELIGGQKYLSMQFDITNACNLSCAHCYHPDHNNKGALNFDQWRGMLDQYDGLRKKLYLEPSIIICGGEPFTSPMLFPLLEEINTRWNSVQIFILTNGTKLNEDLVKKLTKYNVTVQVSLDGAFVKTHDLIRGAGSFGKAIKGISLLRESKIPTVIQSILSKNTSSQIEEFFMLARMLNANAMNFTRFIPSGNGKVFLNSGRDSMLSSEELKDSMSRIVAISKRYKVPTNTDQPLYSLIDSKLGASGKFGFQGLVVDYKGNLKVSSRTDYILGNLLTQNLEELFFNHPTLIDLRDREKSVCGGCEQFSRCGGNRNLSYALTGSFLEKDPSCWRKETTNLFGEDKYEIS